MDINLTYVMIIGAFAVLVIVAFLRFRQRTNINLKGPLGTGLNLDASNEPSPFPPAVKGENIKSRTGGLKAHDETGRGVDVKDVDVEKDVDLKSVSDPKAAPPA